MQCKTKEMGVQCEKDEETVQSDMGAEEEIEHGKSEEKTMSD